MADSIVNIAIRASNLTSGAVRSAISGLTGLTSATSKYKQELQRLDKEAEQVKQQLDALHGTQGYKNGRKALQDRLRDINQQRKALQTQYQQSDTQLQSQNRGLLGLNSAYLLLGATIGAVTLAYNKLQNAASSAMRTQTERIGAVATVQSSFQLGAVQSTRFYQNVEREIEGEKQ